MIDIWTDQQVENLKLRQKSDFHPYTCECGEELIPTNQGWICEKCDYTQKWAHECDLNIDFERNDIV